jgi:hypothetical protein
MTPEVHPDVRDTQAQSRSAAPRSAYEAICNRGVAQGSLNPTDSARRLRVADLRFRI